MKSRLLALALFSLTISFISCEPTDANLLTEDMESGVMNEVMSIPAMSTDSTDLTDSDHAGLLKMREEEKLAQDVYDSFYNTYNLIVFDRISNSEIRHTEAVLSLINYYKMTDPAIAEAGKFSNVKVQDLYDKLIASGTSDMEALKTGAYIEEYDIADLKKLIVESQNQDIVNVYAHLLRGSEFHLRAFNRNLKVRGIVYERQILSEEDFNTILSGKSIAPAIDSTGQCIML